MRNYLLQQKHIVLGFAVFVLAFGVFSVSILNSSPHRIFASTLPTPKPILETKSSQIDYVMPYPGKILPDNPVWSVKAMRDWFWYYFTQDHLKKAELALLFSDKRLMSSKALFELKKPDIALSTLTKGEKYLEIAAHEEEIARKKGKDTSVFIAKLVNASLKHRQIIEEEILVMSPEDIKPEIVKVEDYAKNTYKSSRDTLNSKGISTPKDPFNGQ